MRKLVDPVPGSRLRVYGYELRMPGGRDLRPRQHVQRRDRRLQLQLRQRQLLLGHVQGQLQRAMRQRQRLHADRGKQRQHSVRSRDLHAHGRRVRVDHLRQRRDVPRHVHRPVVLGVVQRVHLRPEVPGR